jgi:hypothetical protein
MTNASKVKWIAVAVFGGLLGLREDVDYCVYTAEWRSCYRVWGVPVPFTWTHDDSCRVWIEHDLGVSLPQHYVDHLNYHPIFVASSSPPGNWLYLRNLRQIYDRDPRSHAEVAEVVRAVSLRAPPRFIPDDHKAHRALSQKYRSMQ